METIIKINSFSTDSRTENNFVLMNTRFVPRAYTNKNGESRIELHIISKEKQKNSTRLLCKKSVRIL